MNVEEDAALNKFVELLKSNNVVYNQNEINNNYLIRFLRARKLDLNKTLEMFINYLKWRKENNVDEIESFEFPEAEKLKVFYPHGLHKTDKLGRPIYIEVLGELKVDEMYKITTPERLLQYQTREYEKLLKNIFPTCSKVHGSYISQTFMIIDLKKMTSKLLSKKIYSFLKLTSFSSQNYYPEILGQLYIVNTGLLFKAAWSVCKAFLDEKTKKKIITVGSDYKKKLLEHIEPDNLPKFLGGNCECLPSNCMYSNAGPWSDGEPIMINPQLIELKLNDNYVEPNENPDERDEIFDLIDEDDLDKQSLEELSKQLNEKMNLSKGQRENTKFKLERQINDGETPINTEEVIFIIKYRMENLIHIPIPLILLNNDS
jgi:hypothetical protein